MVCEICATCPITSDNEEKAKISAAAKKRSEDINSVAATVTDVNNVSTSGFTTMTEGFDTNNFWRNINKFFNKNYNDKDINEIKGTVENVNRKAEGFTTLQDSIKEMDSWSKYVSETKTKFETISYTTMITNIKNNDLSAEAGSVKKELENLEKIFDKNYKLFKEQTIDDLISQIKSYQREANNALADAKSPNGNIDRDKTISQNDLDSIKNLLKKADTRISNARTAHANMYSAVNAIETIVDTPCTYSDAEWSQCKSSSCTLGQTSVQSTVTRRRKITNWKCNSNGVVVKGDNSDGRFIGEEKPCDYACPCVYSNKETPVDPDSCARTCAIPGYVDVYKEEALWNVYYGLENGPGSCPARCDKSGVQGSCKKSTVGNCAKYPAPICDPTGFRNPQIVKSGFTTMNEGFSALTNRPLEGMKHECPCKMNGRNDLSSVKPFYNDNEYSSSVSNDRLKEIPVVLQKNRNQYFALNDTGNKNEDVNVYSDSWADIPTEKEIKKTKKMDVVTQFYFGSLSIVALFVVFRMIQKTK